MSGATPRPWIAEYQDDLILIRGGDTQRVVATVVRAGDAVTIVRAVNAYDDLVAACKAFLAAYESQQAWPGPENIAAARAALAKAGEP